MNDNKLEEASTNSTSTTSTDVSTEQKVSIDKLLNKKQQYKQTAKKQTPLEKYLADYKKTLENKSPEELEKEKKRLEFKQKISLIASIIGAIAFLAVLILVAIFLPLAPALIAAIPCGIGAIALPICGIYDYKRKDKMIDIINTRIAQKQLQITPRGNKKNQYINNGQSNNKDASVKNINNNNVNSNNTQDKNEKKNINNNKSNKNDAMSNNILANKKNSNINTNTSNKTNNISKNITQQVTESIKKIPQSQSVNNGKQSDEQQAENITNNTLNRILSGTLDLSSRPTSQQEYEQCKNELTQAKSQVAKAFNQQKMMKYEIWSQLSSTQQQAYEQLTKEHKSPEEILKQCFNGDTNWQVILYNKHIENEEQKNQSLLNPTNWSIFKHKKNIEEKQQAVKKAILGQQQKNGIKLLSVGQQTGDNYNSGAIKSEDMKIKVNQQV